MRTNAATHSWAIENRPVPRRQQPRRFWSHVMLFASLVLLVNGLFGERGLLESLRARRAYAAAIENLERLRQENDALRERARLLRNDPRTIESVAREQLGLARPDEILVTIRDLKPSSQ
jgi:cell division protein FtsB